MGYLERDIIQDCTNVEKFRTKANKSKAKIGVGFLDDVIGNLIPGEFVLIMADSGIGKTSMLFNIAQKNAMKGVRVLLIALESFDGEFSARGKFGNLSRRYYQENLHKKLGYIFYDEWIKKEYNFKNIDWLAYEAQAGIELLEKCDGLNIIYRDEKGFTYKDFETLVESIKGCYDLIVLDHISYFDMWSSNTNKEEGFIAKHMKAVADKIGVSIISAAHINKTRDKNVLIYDKESIMGSSDIYKNATTIISMSQISNEKIKVKYPDIQFPTLFRLCKGRYYGSTKNFVAAHVYNLKKGDYDEDYEIYRLKNGDTDIEFVGDKKYAMPNIFRKKDLKEFREREIEVVDVYSE